MIQKYQKYFKKVNSGFSLIEILVAVAIFSFIVLAVVSFFISVNFSNTRSKANREAQENARRMMDIMTYEIKNAKGIYSPTTTLNQLSLETARHLPVGETATFIDFFLCGANLCLKKESQNPIILNSDTVEVYALSFTRILTEAPLQPIAQKKQFSFLNILPLWKGFEVNAQGTVPSIQIVMSVKYKNPNNDEISAYSITLTSTSSLREY